MRIQDLRENMDKNWTLKQKLPASLPIVLVAPIKNRKEVMQAITEIANLYKDGYHLAAARVTKKAKLTRMIFRFDVFAIAIAGPWGKVREAAAKVEKLQNEISERSDYMGSLVMSFALDEKNTVNYRQEEQINQRQMDKVAKLYKNPERYFEKLSSHADYKGLAKNQLEDLVSIVS